jgi:hypothetical protein
MHRLIQTEAIAEGTTSDRYQTCEVLDAPMLESCGFLSVDSAGWMGAAGSSHVVVSLQAEGE